jgi:hypothetical protein
MNLNFDDKEGVIELIHMILFRFIFIKKIQPLFIKFFRSFESMEETD